MKRLYILAVLCALLSWVCSAQLLTYSFSTTSPITTQQATDFPLAVSFWESTITGRYLDRYLWKDPPPLSIQVSGKNLGANALGYARVLGADYYYISGDMPVRREYVYPYLAEIVLNTAFAYPVTDKAWTDIIEHEIAHTLGFGITWNDTKWGDIPLYVDGTGRYTGPNGLQAYRRETGQLSVSYVPVELDGGLGTKDSHWDEGVKDSFFYGELMEGWISISKGAWVSDTTIASMRDLGYDTISLRTDVPEPSTCAGLLVPVVGFLFVRRRK